jgi:hypothetical protein
VLLFGNCWRRITAEKSEKHLLLFFQNGSFKKRKRTGRIGRLKLCVCFSMGFYMGCGEESVEETVVILPNGSHSAIGLAIQERGRD